MPPKSTPTRDAFLFLALCIGLSYLIFWGPLALFQITTISFVSGEKGPLWAIILFMLGGFVPSGTALVLTGLREGRPGMRALWQRMIQVRLGWRWYGAALGIVAACAAGQLLIHAALGNRFDLRLFLTQLGSFLPLIVIGPLSEELGWRGYAQTRLQARWNPLLASLAVGVVWGFWHLPLFLIPGTSQHELAIPFPGFLAGVTALSVVFAWLQDRTGGSLWTAIFFHWIYTYAAQVVATGVTRSPTYNLLEYLPFILIGLIVALLWRGRPAGQPVPAAHPAVSD